MKPFASTDLPPLARRETLAEQIADFLGQQIITGTLPPGHKFKELDLARELNASSNTVREALLLLEKTRLVTSQPRKGSWVSPITPEAVTNLYQFLFMLLARLAEEASHNWQGDDLAPFAQLVADMEGAYQDNDVPRFHELAFSFIDHGLKFTNNDYLKETILQFLPQLKRFSFLAITRQQQELLESMEIYRKLMANLLARHAHAAAEAIVEYGNNQQAIVIAAINQQETAS